MKIYMIEEGCADYNVLTRLGAYVTKEAAEKALRNKGEKDPEFLRECKPRVIEIELHK